MAPLVEPIEIVLGTMLLLLPAALAIGLAVWGHRLSVRGRAPYLPGTLGACGLVAGVVQAATAGEGLEAIGDVLFGAYLAFAGALVLLVVLVSYLARPRGDRRRDVTPPPSDGPPSA